MEWFDKNDLGTLPTKIDTNLLLLVRALDSRGIRTIVTNAGLGVGSLGLAFASSWQVSLIHLAAFPASFVLFMAILLFLKNETANTQTSYAQAGSVAEEVFHNFKTVVAFGAEHQEADRYSSKLDAARVSSWKVEAAMGSLNALLLGQLSFWILAAWYGGVFLVAKNEVR